MKKLVTFFLGLLLFLCPIAVQSEEMGKVPAPVPMSEDTLNYLLSEDLYQALFLGKPTKLEPNLITTSQRKNR